MRKLDVFNSKQAKPSPALTWPQSNFPPPHQIVGKFGYQRNPPLQPGKPGATGKYQSSPPITLEMESDSEVEEFYPHTARRNPPQNFAIWDLSPAAAHTSSAVRIAAVGAGGSAANSNVTWLGDPLTGQIMKNLIAPTFAGNNEDWPRFTLAWEKYWAKLGSHRKTSNFEKLQLLESCLDEMNRRELQLMYKAAGGKQITFC